MSLSSTAINATSPSDLQKAIDQVHDASAELSGHINTLHTVLAPVARAEPEVKAASADPAPSSSHPSPLVRTLHDIYDNIREHTRRLEALIARLPL
jgi:hypothetical protein